MEEKRKDRIDKIVDDQVALLHKFISIEEILDDAEFAEDYHDLTNKELITPCRYAESIRIAYKRGLMNGIKNGVEEALLKAECGYQKEGSTAYDQKYDSTSQEVRYIANEIYKKID